MYSLAFNSGEQLQGQIWDISSGLFRLLGTWKLILFPLKSTITLLFTSMVEI